MADTFTFELVSPEKLLFSKPVAMVTVPGGEGEYGVLSGHAPMITTITPGVIQIYEEENAGPVERIFVAGGFAEVSQTRFTVLAGEAVPVSDLNRAALQEQAKAIAGKIDSANEHDLAALKTQQDVIAAKIQAAA